MLRQPVSVTYLPSRRTVEARIGDTLLDAAIEHGIQIEHECGGNCTCTTCHVHILSGADNLSPMEEPESYRLQFADKFAPESRLSCQAILKGGPVLILIPEHPNT